MSPKTIAQRQPQQSLNVLINSRILSHPHCIVEKTEPLSRSHFLIMLITHGKATKFASFDRNIHCAHFLMTLFIKKRFNSQSQSEASRLRPFCQRNNNQKIIIIIIIISIYSKTKCFKMGNYIKYTEICLNRYCVFGSDNYCVKRSALY